MCTQAARPAVTICLHFAKRRSTASSPSTRSCFALAPDWRVGCGRLDVGRDQLHVSLPRFGRHDCPRCDYLRGSSRPPAPTSPISARSTATGCLRRLAASAGIQAARAHPHLLRHRFVTTKARRRRRRPRCPDRSPSRRPAQHGALRQSPPEPGLPSELKINGRMSLAASYGGLRDDLASSCGITTHCTVSPAAHPVPNAAERASAWIVMALAVTSMTFPRHALT